jgi:hypothetical protein
MSLIERWWIVTDPIHGTLAVEDTESEAHLEAAERGCGEVVEVVPASQHQGAVAALVEIANGSRWTAIQTRAHAVAALEAMGVDPYAERKVERPA